MKTVLLLVPTILFVVGCSSGQTSAQDLSPEAKMTAKQSLEKIRDDPKMPDGLKAIKMDTLRRQPGVDR